MALLIEEVGLLAADRRREEPLTIVRPSRTDTTAGRGPGAPARTQPAAAAEERAPRVTGHQQMLAAALQRGMVRG